MVHVTASPTNLRQTHAVIPECAEYQPTLSDNIRLPRSVEQMFPPHADLFQDRKHDKFTGAGKNAAVEEFLAAAYL
jgi:hypothetical protein